MSNTDTEFNKLTGDADLVLAKSRRYEELGQAIARSVSTLKRISEGDGQKSQAIDALKDSAKNVARDIGKAEGEVQPHGQGAPYLCGQAQGGAGRRGERNFGHRVGR